MLLTVTIAVDCLICEATDHDVLAAVDAAESLVGVEDEEELEHVDGLGGEVVLLQQSEPRLSPVVGRAVVELHTTGR